MDVEEFNRLAPDAAASVVRPCAAIGSWVDQLVAGRPYTDVDELVGVADLAARSWSRDEVDEALTDHPRIGAKHRGLGTSAAMSARDQRAIDPMDADLLVRLSEGNRAYEERFGRIFLIRARGLTSQQILDALEERMHNDPDTEDAVVADQLREIAILRLREVLA
ncbi:2-oxo-4-hydroxy-4-carboxy-5-ureidoimidazoline decarboxylase [Nocardioides pacificus]